MARTALITGATSGIGLELARLFARDGHNVILVARRIDKLALVAGELRGLGVEALTIAKDLAKPGVAEEIYGDTHAANVQVDYLVNNAGDALHGPFSQSDLSDDLDNMQLNMVSLVTLTRLYLDDMLPRGEGKILNLGSTAAFQAGPLMALYYASKAFVLSFSEAIANELRGSGVTVTCLCPGPTATGFQKRGDVGGIRLVTGSLMDAATVARQGYRAMMRGQPLVIAGLRNIVMVWGSKLSPRRIPIAVVRYLHEKA